MRKTYWMMIAVLICGSAMFTACEHEDNPVKPDTVDETLPKISKIYWGGSMVMKKQVMDTWMTLMDVTYERELREEFFWTGNRLDSVKSSSDDGTIWCMQYDEQGRLVGDYKITRDIMFTFEYDSEGRMSKSTKVSLLDEMGHHNYHYTDYIYDGDKLIQKVTIMDPYDVEGTHTEVCDYTWDGDNIVAITAVIHYADGTDRYSSLLTAEYSDRINPFRNIVHFQMGMMPINIGDDMWALSKNIPSKIYAKDSGVYEFDCNASGSFVNTINAHYVVDSEIVSSESTYNYDIEYEKD